MGHEVKLKHSDVLSGSCEFVVGMLGEETQYIIP